MSSHLRRIVWKFRFFPPWFALAVCILCCSVASADGSNPVLAIGAPVPDFSLKGADGKVHKLSEYSKAKVLAVIFECDTCPVSQLYEARIEKLRADYVAKGAAIVAINPNNPGSIRLSEESYSDVGDSLEDMTVRAQVKHFDYPYLYDGETQSVSSKFGVQFTPQIFIFDKARKLRYEGAVDDNIESSLVKTHYAAEAIDALLAGQAVNLTATAAFGCPTKWLSNAIAVKDEMAKIEAEPVDLSLAGPDELKRLRANPTGKVLLINFWATWCGPCVSEFPDLEDTYRMYRDRGLEMVTVSENDPEARPDVLKFLQDQHASSVNMIFSSENTASLQEAFDHNMGSAVPYTVVFAPNGNVLYQEEGDVTILALRQAILSNLPDPKEYPGEEAYWLATTKQ